MVTPVWLGRGCQARCLVAKTAIGIAVESMPLAQVQCQNQWVWRILHNLSTALSVGTGPAVGPVWLSVRARLTFDSGQTLKPEPFQIIVAMHLRSMPMSTSPAL